MEMLLPSLKLVSKMRDRLIFQWDSIKVLMEEDASLSLGWFEFYFDRLSVSFFKERSCMVFITITSLIDFLSSETDNNSFEWIGEDSGEKYLLRRNGEVLQIQNSITSIIMSYNLFESIVFDASLNLKNSISMKNPHIKKEGAFIDFENSLKKKAENTV